MQSLCHLEPLRAYVITPHASSHLIFRLFLSSMNSFRNRSYPFLCRTFITAFRHRCGTFRWCFTSCVIRWNSRSKVGSWGYLVFCRVDPESVCDRPLGEPFDVVESQLVRFRVQKGTKEQRSPSEDEPRVSYHPFPFVTNVFAN